MAQLIGADKVIVYAFESTGVVHALREAARLVESEDYDLDQTGFIGEFVDGEYRITFPRRN
jgi:hypothetical protein